MVGRFFEALQQRVRRRVGEHVNLVEDVDLLPAERAREGDPLEQVTRVLHATIRRRVQLEQVDEPSVGNRDAVLADAARFAVVTEVLAVQGLGEQPSSRRLARASRPAEQVRVADAAVSDRIAQRVDDVLLAVQLRESLWTVLPVQRLVFPVRHRSTLYIPRRRDPSLGELQPAWEKNSWISNAPWSSIDRTAKLVGRSIL